MESLEVLRRKISTSEDLYSIVKTMKTLAAVNIRQYEKAVEALAEYNRTVEWGLHLALTRKPKGAILAKPATKQHRLAAIVFGSDHGMCGPLNERIISHALEEMNRWEIKTSNRAWLAIGLRIGFHLEDAGQVVEERLAVPGSKAGVAFMAQDLLVKIEEWQAEQGFDRIVLFYNKLLAGYRHTPRTVSLLPLDFEWIQRVQDTPWPSHALPIFTMEWDRLFSFLIRQYLFVSLCRALTESLASENAGRLVSMQGAERNIKERLEELSGQFRQQRQMSITEELLDIVAGFEALQEPNR